MALQRAWRDMDPGEPGSGSVGLGSSVADLQERAWSHLVMGAGYRHGVSPREALESLRLAEAQFSAIAMFAMCQATRIEAAWQYREAGFPLIALRSLDSHRPPEPSTHAHGRDSVRAMCMVDLGQLEDASRALEDAREAAGDNPASRTLRERWYFRSATMQLRAAQHLRDRGIHCHLSEPFVTRNEGTAPVKMGARRRAGGDWLVDDSDVPSSVMPEHRTLGVLADIASAGGDSPRARARLSRLATDLTVEAETVDARTWLWLGTAQLALGDAKMATATLGRALSTARSSGQTRVARGALIDLADAFERTGLANEALAAHKELRSLEAQIHASHSPLLVETKHQIADGKWPDLEHARNPHLRRALRILSTTSAHHSVGSLAEACGASRRTLEKAFRSELGHSISEILKAKRISLVRAKLIETEDPIKKIAFECGYASSSALCHDFKRTTGLTPSGFRTSVG